MATLRLGVPAWTFVRGEMGGSETYARALCRSLSSREDVEVTTFVNPSGRGALTATTEVVEETLPRDGSLRSRVHLLSRGLRPSASTRRALAGCDVLHYPFTVALPRGASQPYVVTLHDVQHLDLPGLFSPAERAYRRWAYDTAARRAAAVVTVSEFCRLRIVERLGVDADRVHVVPHGVDPPAPAPPSRSREPFVLYPARAWQHKNHGRLLEAMAIARRRRPDLRLVLTGGGRELLGPLPDWAEHRGTVSWGELGGLFGRAGALVFPSTYEGFGLPVLEAMSHGCPVAAADLPPLREVADGLADWFDPTDTSAMAAAVLDALEADSSRVEAGVERASRFTWQQSAEGHAAVYRFASAHA